MAKQLVVHITNCSQCPCYTLRNNYPEKNRCSLYNKEVDKHGKQALREACSCKVTHYVLYEGIVNKNGVILDNAE